MENNDFNGDYFDNGFGGSNNGVFSAASAQGSEEFERASYGKVAFKRVKKLRKKGARRGIDVPMLNYELTKPEKPRIAFLIVAIISALLFVGIVVGIFLLYNELIKMFSDLSGINDLIKTVFDPDMLAASFGWSALPGILMVVVYIMIALLFALPIFAAIYFYRFVRDTFYMVKCSKEEFAKGSMISSRIIGLVAVLIASTVIFVILMMYITAGAKLYAGLVFAGLVIALGGLLAVTFYEKIKCGKWFEDLDESKKQNYLAHEQGLRRVKTRLKNEKDFWGSIGK